MTPPEIVLPEGAALTVAQIAERTTFRVMAPGDGGVNIVIDSPVGSGGYAFTAEGASALVEELISILGLPWFAAGDLGAQAEIAKDLGVTASTFRVWESRYGDTPQPVLKLSSGAVHSKAAWRAWRAERAKTDA